MKSDNTALWDRSRVQEFKQKFVDNPRPGTGEKLIDRTLKGKLKAWAPQFMLILLDYYRVYQRDGLRPTAAVLQATCTLRQGNDPFVEFIEEHYQLTELETDRISKSAVNEAFEKWCTRTPEHKDLIKRKYKAFATLKDAMGTFGFDLGEEIDVKGKTKPKPKRVHGIDHPVPAYSFIRPLEDTEQ